MLKMCTLPVLFAAMLGAVSASAQEPWTLQQCVSAALSNSVQAANARRDEAMADARVSMARAEALPSISLSASYTRLDELQEVTLDGESIEVGTLDNYEANAGVRQILYSGGRVGAALKASKLARRASRSNRFETESALVRDVTVTFYQLLVAEEAVDVYAESVLQLERSLAQTEARARSGAASEFDVLSAKVRVANERPLLIAASNRVLVVREQLARLVDVPGDVLSVTGALEICEVPKSMPEWVAYGMGNRSALAAMADVVGLRAQDLRAAGSGQLPDLSAQFNYNGANSYGFVTFDDEWQWHWNAGVVLAWTLWDGGATSGKKLEKRLAYEQSVDELADLKRAVALEIKQAYLEMERGRETVQATADSVSLAEKALEIARTRYESGLATYLEFSDSNLALSRARLMRLEAILAFRAALADLCHAAGLLEFQEPSVGEQSI